jgi:hypothetical protein
MASNKAKVFEILHSNGFSNNEAEKLASHIDNLYQQVEVIDLPETGGITYDILVGGKDLPAYLHQIKDVLEDASEKDIVSRSYFEQVKVDVPNRLRRRFPELVLHENECPTNEIKITLIIQGRPLCKVVMFYR